MAKYFGTDGIRGQFGAPHMCPQFAYRLGCALGHYLKTTQPDKPLHAVIGRDTRASGPALCDALVAGLCQHSVYVYDTQVVPTPAVARSVIERDADLGIVVTASHNPACDNGIKLFDARGCKMDESRELLIEQLLDQEPEVSEPLPEAKAYPLDASAFYIDHIRSLMDQNCLSDWKVVMDLANGATYETSPAVFRRWGAELVLLGIEPDGTNINKGVGSECPDQLARVVLAEGADIGIAHDGDGDRLVVCDETGKIVDGDILLGLFGRYAMATGALGANTLVATVHSNLGLDRAIEDVGGRVLRADVGDRNVAQSMRESGSNIGGESSGHIIFSDFATTGDGLLAAVKVIDLMRKTGKRLSQLREEVQLFPQMTKNLKVVEKLPLESLVDLNEAIAQSEKDFGQDGRVLVRYSGTEPKLRLLVEGKEPSIVADTLSRLENAARKNLDVIDS